MRSKPKFKYFEGQRHGVLGMLALLLATVSTIGSATNIIPLSPAIVLLGVVGLVAGIKYLDYIKWYLPLVAMLAYVTLSSAFYDFSAFWDYQFYRRDGNIYVAYVGLFAFLLIKVRSARAGIRFLILWVSSVNFICLIPYLGGHPVFAGDGAYPFLFTANNAAGGCLVLVGALASGYLLKNWRDWVMWGSMISCGAGVYFTASRGSMVAFVCAVLFVIFVPMRKMILAAALAVLIVAQVAVAWFGYMESGGGISYYGSGMSESEVSFLSNVSIFGSAGKSANVSNRILDLWASALHVFLDSPIVGIGFGGFDDRPYNFKGLEGIFMYNSPYIIEHSDSHAHNTLLHFAAEGGIIMVALYIWLICAIYKQISHEPDIATRKAALIAFFTLVIASASEHRFVTPSNAIVFVLALGWISSAALERYPMVQYTRKQWRLWRRANRSARHDFKAPI